MSLFKILKGDSSRIDVNVTPFRDGYAYFTPDDGGFYIDSEDNGVQRRIRINPPNGSVGGGPTLSPVSNISTQVASGKVYIKWNDPEDIVSDGSNLAIWKGTVLVRKVGSVPASRHDGTVVLDSTVRDQYSGSYFCDSGLTNDVTYYYKFFSYTTAGTYTENEQNEFTATPTAQVTGIEDWLVTDMSASAEAGDGKMAVKWTDPAVTLTADGVTLATWASTTVVVKAGSYPTGKDDADADYTMKVITHNQYAGTPLMVAGLTNGTQYYVAFYPETADGGINVDESQRTTGVANRITISAVPRQNGTLIYNTNPQTPNWDNYDSTQMTLGGTATATGTDAGSYTATFIPKSDYRWSDGSVTAKSVPWAIQKAPGMLTLSESSVILDSSNTVKNVAATRSGTGVITAESSNADVATVSVNDTTITIKSVNGTTGTATITVKVAASNNYDAPADKTIAVMASFKPIASTSALSGVNYTAGLSGLSATEVSQFAEVISNNSSITNTTSTVYVDFGSVHRKLSVGDQISLALNGTDYAFDIIGFNHDQLTTATAYGNATATGKAGITLQMHDTHGMKTQMNSSDTNVGGWNSARMHSYTMPTMKNYLPSAWRDIIKPVSKKTSAGNQSTTINTTSDSCFLLSEAEIFSRTSFSASGEGSQYAYYKAGNSKIKNWKNSGDNWWTRSPAISLGTMFIRVTNTGSVNAAGASYSHGVAFAFCV